MRRRYATPPHTQTGLFVPEWGKLFAAGLRFPDSFLKACNDHNLESDALMRTEERQMS
jgi:hypothetical protein